MTSRLLLIVTLTGCFDPSPPGGRPCAPDLTCPSPLMCVAGTCVNPGGDGGVTGSPKVLFIRGGNGTLGFNNGGTDDNAADIDDTGNGAGWGKLAAALRGLGFVVEQRSEGPKSNPGPADLSNISGYAVIVFGSNNAAYSDSTVTGIKDFVRAGGGALFISDAGFCTGSYAPAPTSDSRFMASFDLAMNQDFNGDVTERTNDFAMPAHPVLEGVSSFTASGTSAITVLDAIADVTPVILVPRKGQVRRNDGNTGSVGMAKSTDAALVVVDVGQGRVAGYFDRDTFLNDALGDAGNQKLAVNLFRWLAHQ